MLGELLHDEEVLFSVWLTLKVAAVCLALHLITAVPLALWARSPKAPFRRTLNFVVTLPLVFPPIALGYLLLMALGQTGLGEPLQRLFGVRLIFSQAAVVLAAYIAGLPLVIKPVQAALGSETVRKLTEAARVTGARSDSRLFSRGHSADPHQPCRGAVARRNALFRRSGHFAHARRQHRATDEHVVA